MGRIHYRTVSLPETIAQSSAIAIARRVGEPETIEVSIGEGLQPYSYAEARWEVLEWLRPVEGGAPGDTLVLSGFDSRHGGRRRSG